MCQAFFDNGHKLELLQPRIPPVKTIKENFWDYYQLAPNRYVLKSLPCLILPETLLTERFFSHLRYFVMSWSYSLGLVLYLFTNKRKYVHLFTECKEILVLLKLIKLIYSPTVVYEVHILPGNFYERLLEKIALSRVDIIVTTTHKMAEYYTKKNFAGKIEVLPNSINLQDFDYQTSKSELRKGLKLPSEKIIVGYGGRFLTNNMEKGIPELISAMGILKKENKKLFLVCVGGPEEQIEKYRRLAKENNLAKDDYYFIGHVPPKTLYKYMRAFDVCAMPFPWTEHYAYIMAPLKMFEYMATKNPIIATDLPSVKEVLIDRETALLAEPGSPESLALGIKELITNKKLAETIATQAFQTVSQKYTWRHRAKRVLSLITASQYTDQSLPK
ncbi:glycosyltransferase family 4 protein [Patescibacteria group bacterium]|nr:glycosyltransferase family 4 protein [Patescibacteria group bacterium]